MTAIKIFSAAAAIFGICALTACAEKKTEAQTAAEAATKCGAQGGAARKICADVNLLTLDRQIVVAYAAAQELYAGDAEALRALSQAQSDWASWREDAGEPNIGLQAILESHREFLKSLSKPRERFTGRWISPLGVLDVAKEPDGLTAHIESAEPLRGAWVCEADAPAEVRDSVLVIADGPRSSGESWLDGWTIAAARAGALLKVSDRRPKGKDGGSPARPFCGMNGGVDGYYFPANPAQPRADLKTESAE